MKKQRGFTLIELLVVLSIVAVLAFFAQPVYVAIMQRVEAHTARRYIHESIRLAKIESRVRGKDVIICAMHENSCSKTAQDSFVVFVDKNRNNRFDSRDIIISREKMPLKYGIIEMRASGGRDYMKFMGDTGKPRGNFGHIKYCNIHKQKIHSFQIVINAHGIVSERRGNKIEIGC